MTGSPAPEPGSRAEGTKPGTAPGGRAPLLDGPPPGTAEPFRAPGGEAKDGAKRAPYAEARPAEGGNGPAPGRGAAAGNGTASGNGAAANGIRLDDGRRLGPTGAPEGPSQPDPTGRDQTGRDQTGRDQTGRDPTGLNPTDEHGLLRDGPALTGEARERLDAAARSVKAANDAAEPFAIGRRGTVRSGGSMLTAFWILAREGVIGSFPVQGAPGPVRLVHRLARAVERTDLGDRPQRLARALHRLGPSWVKLGQFLATRPDVVGTDLALDLETLQDRMMPFDADLARARFEATTERRIEATFSEFSRPIAAASVAQVHRARRRAPRPGQSADVAVKVVRPGVRRAFARDLATFYGIARLLERFVPAMRRLRPIATTDMLAASARLEMDLRLEAAAFSELAENTARDPGFRLPAIHWDLTGRDALVMDWVDGVKLNNIEGIERAGIDRRALAVTLMQSFLRHTLRDGFFHADMHPGNLFATRDGTVVAIDMGIAGRLDPDGRRFLAEILYGFIRRDYRRVAEVHFEAGYVPADQDVATFAQAIRAVGEPIHGQRADEVSMANVLTLLFEITDLFDMHTQPQLLLLQKTMVVVEGICRTLDPEFDMWSTAEPIVRGWIARNLGPAAALKDARAGIEAGRRLLREGPLIAERLERGSVALGRLADEGLRLDEATTARLAAHQHRARRTERVALWVIAGCAAATAFALL